MFKPPRDGLIRAKASGFEIRSEGGTGMPTLHGYAIRFGEWTRIDSYLEGTFMERIAPGAAKKTIAESGDKIKVLFNHGMDPTIGEKALAKPELSEDSVGVSYSGKLFDTSYNRDLIPGLESGQYGASFKFRVIKESVVQNPERSEYNPDGIPERTVEEMHIWELGPVTFPAYESASAGVRSLTGHFVLETLKRSGELDGLFSEWVRLDPERTRSLLEVTNLEASDTDASEPVQEHSTPEPSESHSEQSRDCEKNVPLYGTRSATSDAKPDWLL